MQTLAFVVKGLDKPETILPVVQSGATPSRAGSLAGCTRQHPDLYRHSDIDFYIIALRLRWGTLRSGATYKIII